MGNLTRSLFGRFRVVVAETMLIKLPSRSFVNSLLNYNADPFRYFTRGKLDYPNSETTKASKKYVKAMKHLHVSSSSSYWYSDADSTAGNYSSQYHLQQAVPRSSTQDICI